MGPGEARKASWPCGYSPGSSGMAQKMLEQISRRYEITRTISLDLQGTQIDIWYDLGKVHFCFLPELLSFNTVSPRKQRQWCLDAQKVTTCRSHSNSWSRDSMPRIVPEVVVATRGLMMPHVDIDCSYFSAGKITLADSKRGQPVQRPAVLRTAMHHAFVDVTCITVNI